MSTVDSLLETAGFPDEYAEQMIQTLGIRPDNILHVKDALYHFRRLDDTQAQQVVTRITSKPTR